MVRSACSTWNENGEGMMVVLYCLLCWALIANGGRSGGYSHRSRISPRGSMLRSNHMLIMLTFLKTMGGPHPAMLYIRNRQNAAHLLALYVLRAKNVFKIYFNDCILKVYISTHNIFNFDPQNLKHLLAGPLEENFADLCPILLITARLPGHPLLLAQIFLISLNLTQFNYSFQIPIHSTNPLNCLNHLYFLTF